MNAMNQRYQAFDAAEHVARDADPSWEVIKEQGNEALKRGDHLTAAKLYHGAAKVAMGPLEGGMADAFLEALETWPSESPYRRLAEAGDVVKQIISWLPIPTPPRKLRLPGDKKSQKFDNPNKGAAIAWANRAHALLLAGRTEAALKSARKATAANPAYIKGHHREMKALEALGRKKEAAEIREEMEDYGRVRGAMIESLALIAAGWIDWTRMRVVYMPIRFNAAMRELQNAPDDESENRVEVRASIVPFQGGQGLVLSIIHMKTVEKLDCLDFHMVDHENADIADMPPNGHASPASLKRVPQVIGQFIIELEEFGLKTVSVMCGQGLTEHVKLIKRELKQGTKKTHLNPGIRPLKNLVVFKAASTCASEDSGIPAPDFDFSPGAMAAMAARLGL
eukprot:Hpha_TRINITY_DN33458_c0_g1::TRINITY_DN33458_c0_g1_i1::g.707::m.707